MTVGISSEYNESRSRNVSGKAIDCVVSHLNVEPGGVVQNIRVGGYANVGIECSTPEDAAAADAIIAERGTAKLSNFYDDTADKHGGSGSLYVCTAAAKSKMSLPKAISPPGRARS